MHLWTEQPGKEKLEINTYCWPGTKVAGDHPGKPRMAKYSSDCQSFVLAEVDED